MTPDLLDALRVERRRIRRDVAMHVARAIVVQPEQFGELAVGDVLRMVPYVPKERAAELAGQFERRRPVDLWQGERSELALRVARFAKGAGEISS